MKHLGDISKINGAHIQPVDLITFGSPCQDLSVAGKRAGMKHEANGDGETTRSGLFMEAVRIIKEMREATNGNYPRFALWENVPGAFSSNKGEDFRIVLEELIQVVEKDAVMPEVPKTGWPYADSYRGDGWSIAYRVFDAQHWGVPQRRRRIYLVADFGGERAGEVLFKREGLRGDFTPCGKEGQGVAADAENGSGTADTKGTCYGISSYDSNAMKSSNPRSGIYKAETSRTLDLNGGNPACNQGGIAIVEPICMATQQGGAEIRTDDKAPTLTAAAGMSGNNQPVIAFAQNQRDEIRDLGDKAGALQAQPGMKQQTFIIDGVAPASVYEWHNQDTRIQGPVDIACTLNTNAGDREGHLVMEAEETYATDVGFFNSIKNVSPTLLSRGYKDPHLVTYPEKDIRYIVRRLTPTECARLQGFSDEWGRLDTKEALAPEELAFWQEVRDTHAAINGKNVKEYTEKQMLSWYNKLHTDSAEYKMWGNGIALPTALYCMEGIAEVLNERNGSSSLHSPESLQAPADNPAV